MAFKDSWLLRLGLEDVMPCMVDGYQGFGGTCFRRLQNRIDISKKYCYTPADCSFNVVKFTAVRTLDFTLSITVFTKANYWM